MTTYETSSATRSRTHSWEPRPEMTPDILTMTGREILQGALDGMFPPASIMSTLGFRLTDVGDGFTAFEGDPGDHLLNPMGTVHGGFLATLLDSALGSAVMSGLPAGAAYTTVQLGVHLVRPVMSDTPTLRCEGRALHVGRTTATAEAQVIGTHDGKLYAHGTTTCAVLQAS
ncbi:aromatic compound catabolic protein [Streptomyces albiflavescens]|uniref:Aromatic compound catabolic protein n=1 Tax=Streptomyces albiflavescens TaxID=1623582 RepID=A0A917Y755_9ACTN|nr:PaaI family thioesterase [Streptomyces albiflavescens]GGN71968.1 aromatic compound catabolic protein [Streptomyces albiflavescens]